MALLIHLVLVGVRVRLGVLLDQFDDLGAVHSGQGLVALLHGLADGLHDGVERIRVSLVSCDGLELEGQFIPRVLPILVFDPGLHLGGLGDLVGGAVLVHGANEGDLVLALCWHVERMRLVRVVGVVVVHLLFLVHDVGDDRRGLALHPAVRLGTELDDLLLLLLSLLDGRRLLRLRLLRSRVPDTASDEGDCQQPAESGHHGLLLVELMAEEHDGALLPGVLIFNRDMRHLLCAHLLFILIEILLVFHDQSSFQSRAASAALTSI